MPITVFIPKIFLSVMQLNSLRLTFVSQEASILLTLMLNDSTHFLVIEFLKQSRIKASSLYLFYYTKKENTVETQIYQKCPELEMLNMNVSQL